MTARRLAAEMGLAGFTIEQLCTEVGVSRRTFFNYFASKENAVIGIPLADDSTDLEDAFVDGDGPLFEALVELHVARWERLEMAGDEITDLLGAFARDDRLLTHLLDRVAAGEREDIELVERRQGLPAGDLRAATAVQLLSGVFRAAAAEALSPDNDHDIRTSAYRRLAAARLLLNG